jgi:hypothetical protein
MSGYRIECTRDCTCRGQSDLLEPGTPEHDAAILRALDLIDQARAQEIAASKQRHPSSGRVAS